MLYFHAAVGLFIYTITTDTSDVLCNNVTRRQEIFSSILILWNHCCICSPFLTETSLCSTWPYLSVILFTNVTTFVSSSLSFYFYFILLFFAKSKNFLSDSFWGMTLQLSFLNLRLINLLELFIKHWLSIPMCLPPGFIAFNNGPGCRRGLSLLTL